MTKAMVLLTGGLILPCKLLTDRLARGSSAGPWLEPISKIPFAWSFLLNAQSQRHHRHCRRHFLDRLSKNTAVINIFSINDGFCPSDGTWPGRTAPGAA